MEIVILLLKEAIKQYEKGIVVIGDDCVRLAHLIRTIEFEDDNHPPEKPKKVS